jgi:mannose-1-phosphate guanylyltransferase
MTARRMANVRGMAPTDTSQRKIAGRVMVRCAARDREYVIGGVEAAGPFCGLVLAGGEGQRLKDFIRRLRGDSLPKQYVQFTGTRSMLEHTYHRVEKLIPRKRLFTVINQAHLQHHAVIDQLAARRPNTVVVQPENRETGPGLLLPLMHIRKHFANPIVAVFPSDQFVWQEDRLMRHVRLAHAIIARRPSTLVLLGIKPDYQEPEYGYIIPRRDWDASGWGTYGIAEFVEKPHSTRAATLIARGALWNTMIMVFNVNALLGWVAVLRPDLYCDFMRIYDAIGTERESAVLGNTYKHLEKINFSKHLLEPMVQKHLGRLTVLPVNDVTWSDWGSESRVVETLQRIGIAPRTVVAMSSAANQVRGRRGASSRLGELAEGAVV